MANNNYPYSPYFQQGIEQDGRPKQSYSDRMADAYQRQGYPSMSPNQTLQGQAYSQQYASNVYMSQGYADVNATINGREGSTRGYIQNHNPRASVDTTALGSLAYASSLGQDSRETASKTKGNPSMQHLVNHSRSQDRNSYNSSSSNENLYERRSSSSGGVGYTGNGGSRAPQPNTARPTTFPSTTGISTINRGIATPSAISIEQQNEHPTQAVSSAENDIRTSQQYPQPPRSLDASHTRLNPYISQPSPNVAGPGFDQPPKLNGEAQGAGRPEHTQTRTPQLQTSSLTNAKSNTTNARSNTAKSQRKQGISVRSSPVPAQTHSHGRQNVQQQLDNREIHLSKSSRQPITNGLVQSQSPAVRNSASVQSTTSSDDQIPSTVDPSQVFNQYDYQCRQAAAAAETAATSQAGKVRFNDAIAMDPDESKKMELEMKKMIEKMRDYKAKDPSLFSQVWEQVKKGTLPVRASSQPTVQDVPHVESSAAQGASSMINGNHRLPSPSPTHNHLPLESELEIIDPSPKPESDRGKFPAQRRRRGGSKVSSRESASIPKGSSETYVSLNAQDPSNDAVSETMQDAMESYHQNLDPRLHSHQVPTQARTQEQTQKQSQARPEVVHVSGTGPSHVNADMGIRTPGSAPVASMMAPNHEPQADAGNTVINVNNKHPHSGRTIWPKVHKWKLATAATAALTSAPANTGKQLSADEIHQILNKNPSYTELCETLEARGFMIERGPFARTLLAAVPDFGSVRGQEQLQTPRSSSITPISSDSARKPPMFDMLIPPPLTKPLNASDTLKHPSAQVQSPVPSMATNYQSIRWADQNYVTPTVDCSQTQQSNNLQSLLQPLIPTTPARANASPRPLTKEELARKRSFSDIVDLTQGLSDDGDVQPSKFPRIQSRTSSRSTPHDESTASRHSKTPLSAMPLNEKLAEVEVHNFESGPSSVSKAKNIDLSQYNYTPSTATGVGPLTVLGPLPAPSKRDHRFANVVRPMNRNDALRRSSYNPKTICRDILVSSGKHPSMAPLNYHLDILRRNFDDVDSNSDLSTFRWDLVDPGGDPEPSVSKPKSAAIEDIDLNDADDENVELADATQPRSRRGRRSINVTTTVNGEELVVSEVGVDVDVVQRVKGGMSRKGRKSRQDRISGTHSTPIDVNTYHSLSENKGGEDRDLSRHNAGAGASTNYAHIGSDEAGQAASTGGAFSPSRGRPPAQRMFSTPVAHRTVTPTPFNAGSEPKRRGRPPGSKDKSLRKNAAILKSGDMSIRTHPRSSVMNTTPARPSALRHTMTPTDGIAVVIESPSKAKDEKKRNVDLGRPRKRRKASPKSRQPSSPNHQVYKCQWKACPAKLHNLETLRKHIRLHRDGYPVGPFPCLWAGCGNAQEDGSRQSLEFETEIGWDRHMEGRHVDRYAWELGDGPSTHPSGTIPPPSSPD